MLDQIMPKNALGKKWVAILISVVLAWGLTIIGIYGIGQYGIALFVLTPLFIGACPVVLYGQYPNRGLRKSAEIGFLVLGIYTLGLLLFAMEGVICIAMAAPFGILLTWLGSFIGYAIVSKSLKQGPTIMMLLLLSIPATAFMEDQTKDSEIMEVTTTIIIDADITEVWKNVIEFPELDDPTEFLFNAGVSYPISAEIDGRSVGAIRSCNFSTGSFIEPITIWDEPTLLKFDVEQCPPPMKEMSFWDIDAPHLHDYFVSKQGQFKLTELPNGQTRLEGTTWYTHDISPVFYWRWWSDYIVHSIHDRVLEHIKEVSEKN